MGGAATPLPSYILGSSSTPADIDGVKLLEIIGLEMDIPVISKQRILLDLPSNIYASVVSAITHPNVTQPVPAYAANVNCPHVLPPIPQIPRCRFRNAPTLMLCRRGLTPAFLAPSPRTAVMSANGETSTVLRGVTHGAVDFLIKPVRLEELKNVWQHVVRRRRDAVRRCCRCRCASKPVL